MYVFLQSENVEIHKLDEEMYRLIRKFLSYLIPARAIVDVPLKEVKNSSLEVKQRLS